VTFVVFGAVILGHALGHLTWQLLLYAALSLTFVRMVPVVAAMLGTHSSPPTLALLGWFGPRGLASIVFGVILLDDTSLRGESEMLLAVAITVGLSVYAHGLTAGPMTDRYVHWWAAQPDHERAEEAPGDGRAHVRPRWHRPVPPADPRSGPEGGAPG
jgi:NhaP-type Na+/H+ or K+/H+ antiporter